MCTKELYESLTRCCDVLEGNVHRNLCQFQGKLGEVQIQNEVAKQEHFSEIIGHLTTIKTHIAMIRYHDTQLRKLTGTNKLHRSIDKDYIKKQVVTFDNLNLAATSNEIQKRQHKPSARTNEPSQQYFESWEKYLENQESQRAIPTNENSKKQCRSTVKKKTSRARSSTFDLILDNTEEDEKTVIGILDSIEERWNAKNIDPQYLHEIEEDNKPRIVGIVFKDGSTEGTIAEECTSESTNSIEII